MISSPPDDNKGSRNPVAKVTRDEMGRTEDMSKHQLYFCTCMHVKATGRVDPFRIIDVWMLTRDIPTCPLSLPLVNPYE